MDSMPVVWQYVTIGAGTLAIVLVGLWLYNRREKRRKNALKLATLMQKWGMDWFAETYQMYAVGDYSGLVHKVKDIIENMRSDKAMVSKLADVTTKVVTFYVENDPQEADKIRAILDKTPAPPAPPTTA